MTYSNQCIRNHLYACPFLPAKINDNWANSAPFVGLGEEKRKEKVVWAAYGRDDLAAVCLHFHQSRLLNSNNLSNLPFDLFAENTALLEL